MMKKSFLLLLLSVTLFSCASDSDKAIEEARFLLDNGSFAEAIEKLDDIVTEDPTNLEATFLLSTAYVGQAAGEPRPQCQADDTGTLGILACFLRTKDDDDRVGLRTFARIAPATETEVENIRTGIDLLNGIDLDDISKDNSFSTQDVYAQIAIARMITLSTIATIAMANTGDEDDCNADLIEDEDAAAFRSDLELVQDDLANAGFPTDFRLLTRATDILDTVVNAGFTTPTIAVQTLVDDAFDPCECTSCEQATLDAFDL